MTDPILVHFLAQTCFENIGSATSFQARNTDHQVFKLKIPFYSKED